MTARSVPLARTPEPELMDEPEQVRAYANADFTASDSAMIERMAALCGDAPGPILVDLGCGPGNISFRLAHRWPAARVVGIDGAQAMLAIARERLEAEPALEGRLSFQQAVLPLRDPGELAGSCSTLVSNSLLHHLHDPLVLWETLRELAGPGAFVYVQDLRRPSSSDALEDMVRQEMSAAPEVLRRDFQASLHAAFTPAEVEQQLQQAGVSGLQVSPLKQRHLEVWGRLG